MIMGWFSSKKEESLPEIPSLQQVNSGSQAQLSVQVNNPLNVNSVSQDVGSVGQQSSQEQPFFVRIDKFNDAKKNLVEIEKKLRDMESVLAKLGGIKQKEDEEIDSWKQDMKVIKGYLDEINDSVFSRL